MEAIAKLKYLRMSPRKVKIICDMIRGQEVKTAIAYLKQTSKIACEPVLKVLERAKANAENNFSMGSEAALGVCIRYAQAVLTSLPRIRSHRILTLRGEIRRYFR